MGFLVIFKGYVDWVFVYGFVYMFGSEGIVKFLKGKKGLIINIYGIFIEVYDEIGMIVGLKVIFDIGIFDFIGIEMVEYLLFGSIGYFDEEFYKGMLIRVEDIINCYFL